MRSELIVKDTTFTAILQVFIRKSGGSSHFYFFKKVTTITHETPCLSAFKGNGGSSGSRNETPGVEKIKEKLPERNRGSGFEK